METPQRPSADDRLSDALNTRSGNIFKIVLAVLTVASIIFAVLS